MPVVAEMMPPGDRAFDATAIAHAARIGVDAHDQTALVLSLIHISEPTRPY